MKSQKNLFQFVLSILLASASLLLVNATTNAATLTLYAADGALSNAGNLYRVDPATALATTVGPLVDGSSNAYAINGMVYDPATGTLFGSTSGSSPTFPNGLVKINPQTAVVTQIGPLALTPANFAADLDINNGTLYGWAEGSLSALVSINSGTGTATVIGPNGQNLNSTGSGLASNALGTMFSTPNLATGSIWQVNTGTGQLQGPTALSGGTPGARIGALEFMNNTLYGAELVGDGVSGITSNALISINPVTGAITNIGQFRDANSLAFLRNIDAIAAVPEPSSLALAAMGFVGLFRLFGRKNRRS